MGRLSNPSHTSFSNFKENEKVIKKKIRALKDIGLKTYGGDYCLVENEVRAVLFKNNATFKALLEFGNFVEAGRHEEESRPPISVFLPEIEEDMITSAVDESEEEFVAGEHVSGNHTSSTKSPLIELIRDDEEDNYSEK